MIVVSVQTIALSAAHGIKMMIMNHPFQNCPPP